MLVTDKFIFLSMPKTGSTFVTDVMKRIHSKDKWNKLKNTLHLPNLFYQEYRFPHAFENVTYYAKSQHCTYQQIPIKIGKRKVVSVIRNPYERLISSYEFAWWKKHPGGDLEEIKKQHSNFPDLSFSEFVDYNFQFSVKNLIPSGSTTNLGPQTLMHIHFYAYNPKDAIKKYLDQNFVDFNSPDFAKINFLTTESLNKELYDLLATNGYKKNLIEFILKEDKINASSRNFDVYFDEEISKKFYQKEKSIIDFYNQLTKTKV